MTTKSPFLLRLAAATVDTILGFLLGLLLSENIGFFFAERAVVMLRVGAPETLWTGPIPMVMGMFGTFVYVLPFSFFLIFVIEAFSGGTVGKYLFRLRVMKNENELAPVKTLLYRFMIKTSGLWSMIIALLTGSWIIAVISLVATFIILVGFFFAMGSSKQALHDAISGSRLYRFSS